MFSTMRARWPCVAAVSAVLGLLIVLPFAGCGSKAGDSSSRVRTDGSPLVSGSQADQPADIGRKGATFPVPVRRPVSLAVAGPYLFVAGEVDTRAAVVRMSAARVEPLGRPAEIGSSPGPVAIIQGEAIIWVTHRAAGSDPLRLMDPGTRRLIGSVRGPVEPVSVSVGYDSVWVADLHGPAMRTGRRGVVRRATSGVPRFIANIPVGRGPAAIAPAGGSVWVTNALDDTVTQIDPKTNRPVATIRVGQRPQGMAVTNGAVWVANGGDATVTRIDARTGRVRATVPVGRGARAIAYGHGSLWVANELDGSVTRINPRTGRAVETIAVGPGPVAIAYGHEAVWVANSLDDTITRIAGSL
jgi:YVTN family beta-propeller protein